MAEKKSKIGTFPRTNTCANCSVPEFSEGAPKLSICARCGLVLYCSRDCQRAHWKVNHIQYCLTKADRAPLPQHSSGDCENAAPKATAAKESCSICLVSDSSACTLQCTHVFHVTCVAELWKFGVKQMCPLCRNPLPPGPEKLHEEATGRFLAVKRRVAQGEASWSRLSAFRPCCNKN